MIVQGAFGWLVENYPRFADWTASASRLASLLVSLDRLERAEREPTNGRILRKQAELGALRLRDVSVTLDDGSAVVNEADIEIGTRAVYRIETASRVCPRAHSTSSNDRDG